jgi:hypothetical protein
MKKIKNASELIEGKTYFIEAKFRINKEDGYPYIFEFNDNFIVSLNSDLKLFSWANEPLTIYEKSEMQPLKIGKEYEFSNGFRDEIDYFVGSYGDNWRHIREIQQRDEELKAIELLKSLGYKIEK